MSDLVETPKTGFLTTRLIFHILEYRGYNEPRPTRFDKNPAVQTDPGFLERGFNFTRGGGEGSIS